MKSKNAPQTTQSKLRSVLYPALSFGLILAWLALKSQINNVLHGSREAVFYPLFIIAGFDAWVIAVILGGVVLYAQVRAMQNVLDEILYNGTGCLSISVQIIMLLLVAVFSSSSMFHMQSLSTNEHMYYLMKGDARLIGGFAADVMMECDSLGLICHSEQAFIQRLLCHTQGAYLALDPETQELMFYVGEKAYAVAMTTDDEFSRTICADIVRPLLERA